MPELPEIVRAAFASAKQDPPDPMRVDRVGYSAAEAEIVEKEKRRRRKAEEGKDGCG